MKNQDTVLVIDDEDTVLMQVKKILDSEKYNIVCAQNGKEGLEKAIESKPDIIVLDRRMPEMDGNETLIQLKAGDDTRDIPVVMLTGDNMISDVQTSFELGAVDYIVKPFDQDNFLIRVRKALNNAKK